MCDTDFGSAYCLARIYVMSREPRKAYNMLRRALGTAKEAGFRYNAGRLEMCMAEAMAAGSHGAAIPAAQFKAHAESARANLDACKFWLAASKYAAYDKMLRTVEAKAAQLRGAAPVTAAPVGVEFMFPPVSPSALSAARRC